MKDIPITFEFHGKTYSGYFSAVFGQGRGNTWHLMVDKFYYGCLRLNDNGWFFDTNPKSEGMKELAEHFGRVIVAAYE